MSMRAPLPRPWPRPLSAALLAVPLALLVTVGSGAAPEPRPAGGSGGTTSGAGSGGSGRGPSSRQAADLILRGGPIYTMDAARSWAEAVAIKDEKIVYVGTSAGVDRKSTRLNSSHAITSRMPSSA